MSGEWDVEGDASVSFGDDGVAGTDGDGDEAVAVDAFLVRERLLGGLESFVGSVKAGVARSCCCARLGANGYDASSCASDAACDC